MLSGNPVMHSTGELIRNANMLAGPRAYWVRMSGGGPQEAVQQQFLKQAQVWEAPGLNNQMLILAPKCMTRTNRLKVKRRDVRRK